MAGEETTYTGTYGGGGACPAVSEALLQLFSSNMIPESSIIIPDFSSIFIIISDFLFLGLVSVFTD